MLLIVHAISPNAADARAPPLPGTDDPVHLLRPRTAPPTLAPHSLSFPFPVLLVLLVLLHRVPPAPAASSFPFLATGVIAFQAQTCPFTQRLHHRAPHLGGHKAPSSSTPVRHVRNTWNLHPTPPRTQPSTDDPQAKACPLAENHQRCSP